MVWEGSWDVKEERVGKGDEHIFKSLLLPCRLSWSAYGHRMEEL